MVRFEAARIPLLPAYVRVARSQLHSKDAQVGFQGPAFTCMLLCLWLKHFDTHVQLAIKW